jgi:FeS assembly protein IscX
MRTLAQSDPLYWDATYAVAKALQAAFPAIDLEEVSLEDVRVWTQALPNFNDDRELANEEVLLEIYKVWLEETLTGEVE